MLAICESGGGEAWGYVLPVLVVLAWAGALFSIFRGAAGEDRPWLVGLLLIAIPLGLFLLQYPDGLHGDGDYLARFLVSLAVAGALGLTTGLLRGRATVRSVAVALAGDVFLPGLLILLLIWAFVGEGHCLD